MSITSRQSWAIFCTYGVDCRKVLHNITETQCSEALDAVNSECSDEEIRKHYDMFVACGARETGRAISRGSYHNANKFKNIIEEADAAGKLAAEACVPDPMLVNTGSAIEVVDDGVCGFAWVNIKPATTKFARWARKHTAFDRNHHEGGIQLWISQYNQSMARKEAYAKAYAEVLRSYDINAYAGSRLD